MKNYYVVIISILVSIAFNLNGESKNKQKYLKNKSSESWNFISTDPKVYNKLENPSTIPFLVKTNGYNLSARIMLAVGKNPKPTVIFLHGNPGYEKNEDIGQAFRRGGVNSVFFSYSGTWGGSGFFNLSNSIGDVVKIIEYLVSNKSKLNIDTNNIFLFGHSFGADVAYAACSRGIDKYIRGCLFVDIWNGYLRLKSNTEYENRKYITDINNRINIKTSSGDDFVNDIVNDEKNDISVFLQRVKIPYVFIFSSEKEKIIIDRYNIQSVNFNCIIADACDHNFSDKRIELIKLSYKWVISNKK